MIKKNKKTLKMNQIEMFCLVGEYWWLNDHRRPWYKQGAVCSEAAALVWLNGVYLQMNPFFFAGGALNLSLSLLVWLSLGFCVSLPQMGREEHTSRTICISQECVRLGPETLSLDYCVWEPCGLFLGGKLWQSNKIEQWAWDALCFFTGS